MPRCSDHSRVVCAAGVVVVGTAQNAAINQIEWPIHGLFQLDTLVAGKALAPRFRGGGIRGLNARRSIQLMLKMLLTDAVGFRCTGRQAADPRWGEPPRNLREARLRAISTMR